MKESICVFDCETIPDSDSLRKVFGYDGSDKEVAILAQSEQEKATGYSFLPINFHKIVCISAVMADEFGGFSRITTNYGGEKEILSKFLSLIDAHNPRLVSFNGKGFDMPLIMLRAMRYNLSCKAYYEVENRDVNKTKWDNYRYRYSDRFHTDMLEQVSDYGSVRGIRLDSLCVSLNLPGKFDTHGDEVLELFYDDKMSEILAYCESDVLNTYMLFLKYELLKGQMTAFDYANFLDITKLYLQKEKLNLNYTPVFCECIDAELKRLKDEIS